MTLFILRKLIIGLVVFFSVTSLTFLLFFAQGGEAIARKLLPLTQNTPANAHRRAEEMGLLHPLPEQYWAWLKSIFTGGMGNSYTSNQSVAEILSDRYPVTLSLVVVSMTLTIIISLIIGVAAATRAGWIDRTLQILAVVMQALPAYWLALILVIIFGITLRWVPATGYVAISDSFVGWLSTIILPSSAIAIGNVAIVATQLRGTLLDTLDQDFIRTLRSRGIPARSIVYKHALRSAAGPALTMLSLQVIGTISAAVIVESICALPGIGTIAETAATSGDIPVVLGTVTYMVVIVVVVNFAVDLLNGFLNPKARVR